MIVPMKKVSLVVMERDRDFSLEKLREVGVIHLEKKSVSSDSLGKMLERKARIGRAVGILRRYPVKKGAPMPYISHVPSDADFVVHILGLGDEKKILQEQFGTGTLQAVFEWPLADHHRVYKLRRRSDRTHPLWLVC